MEVPWLGVAGEKLDVEHVPVLVSQAVEFLAPLRGGLFVDCTVGLAGHANAFLEASPEVLLVGIDRDPQALAIAGKRLARFGERVRLVHGEFWRLQDLLEDLGIQKVAGIFADLGVSSLQLDRGERGFSFQREGPLDMRMGIDGPTAADIVNHYSEGNLEKIFRSYGEEPQARRVARAVVAARAETPLTTTTELARLVSKAKGGRRGQRVDPATRVFQALRIEVNRELAGLEELLEQAVSMLETDGRLVVLSYHSLEDRIVKHRLRDLDRGAVDPVTGRTLPETRLIEVLTRRPIRSSDEEVAANPRSRSVRMRAARRL